MFARVSVCARVCVNWCGVAWRDVVWFVLWCVVLCRVRSCGAAVTDSVPSFVWLGLHCSSTSHRWIPSDKALTLRRTKKKETTYSPQRAVSSPRREFLTQLRSALDNPDLVSMPTRRAGTLVAQFNPWILYRVHGAPGIVNARPSDRSGASFRHSDHSSNPAWNSAAHSTDHELGTPKSHGCRGNSQTTRFVPESFFCAHRLLRAPIEFGAL